ncbi:hypothetical protein EDWATA_02994 [Edwardsiella tarda ATCC 23685]|uniref:Uncharacterized protein n=1 Tax=Edwardsiella tarda ATCC 23685 TaxID=500638 RepID=D4F8A7_EDWTA|nr:hypothetical protein EDWATA_02994 [Edwardsiella tarda ATCC 23685]
MSVVRRAIHIRKHFYFCRLSSERLGCVPPRPARRQRLYCIGACAEHGSR